MWEATEENKSRSLRDGELCDGHATHRDRKLQDSQKQMKAVLPRELLELPEAERLEHV